MQSDWSMQPDSQVIVTGYPCSDYNIPVIVTGYPCSDYNIPAIMYEEDMGTFGYDSMERRYREIWVG